MADTLRRNLASARAGWLDNGGDEKIETIMRHKTSTLTMDTYGDLFPDSEPDAINQLRSLLGG